MEGMEQFILLDIKIKLLYGMRCHKGINGNH